MRSIASRKRRATIGTDPLAAIIPDTEESSNAFEAEPVAGAEPEQDGPSLPPPSPAPAVSDAAPAHASEDPRPMPAPPAPSRARAPAPGAPAPAPGPRLPDAHDPEPPAGRARKKVRSTLNLDYALNEAMRNTVFALSGPEVQMTLVRFVEDAVAEHIKLLERTYNDGKPFPPRRGPLRSGRPLT
jgi:hypothetical protein